jgi:hypothetical protein
LKTVSLNGKSSFSKIAIIRESGLNEQSLRVSPNPVTGTPKFAVNSNQTQEATVKLLNMAGKTIETMKLKVSKGQNQIGLNGSNFEPGVYMLVVSFADGQIVNEKVVITGR